MEKFKRWFRERQATAEPVAPARRTSSRPLAQKTQAAKTKENESPLDESFRLTENDQIESLGPGKNVLIRNKLVREDSGTHETLKILDDSIIDSGEKAGLDPYNTGEFDRSKNWDRRFRK